MKKEKNVNERILDEEELDEKETRVNFNKIIDTSYEYYKLDWVDTHISIKEMNQKWKDYRNFRDKMIARGFKEKKIPDFDKYVENMGGYSVGIYSKKKDFVQNEFLDGDYMAELLIDEPELYDSYVGNSKVVNKIHYKHDLSSNEIDEMLKDKDDETVLLDDYDLDK